jgi:hypothetical protein
MIPNKTIKKLLKKKTPVEVVSYLEKNHKVKYNAAREQVKKVFEACRGK